MPLENYGVCIGTKDSYYRDPPDDFGKYYHGNVKVSTPAGLYHCAIDVDSKKSNIGVEWRVVELGFTSLGGITDLANGYHALASTSTSGAIDYVRSPMFHREVRIWFVRYSRTMVALLQALNRCLNPPWRQGTSLQALQDLETRVLKDVQRIFVFGEPFDSGLGMHNIHQNQGDPLDSAWAAANGIWQDGCTIVQRSNNSLVAFQNKFTSQSYNTDSNGNPA